MPTSVKLSDDIVSDAKKISKRVNRSIAGQIEYWARIGKIVESNPDLTYKFIKDILISQQDIEDGKLEEYKFEKR